MKVIQLKVDLIYFEINYFLINWLRGLDLNQGPSGYEPDELPDCSTPRFYKILMLFFIKSNL